ncbi:hypothetical protein ALC62_04999 [Cyphomyrmex costatus]|uniref:Uncharacterized protein n=1 Tax=Cyphomyrmex costatus TaxID=456900 RepID=A0A195CU76_9HYME|nr:hypothetical protein ALC62_04999 [Cyphomyrmex costatus]
MHKVVATRLYARNAKHAAIEVETISHADDVWPITTCQTIPLTTSIERLADKTDNLPLSEPQEAGRDGRWCFFSPFQTPVESFSFKRDRGLECTVRGSYRALHRRVYVTIRVERQTAAARGSGYLPRQREREERQNDGGKGGGKKRRGRKNVAGVRKMGRKHRLQGLVTPRYEQRDQAER